ncbi:MAG: hypothetical protein ACKN87_19225 [Microcystis aeruginosa]
MSYQDELMKDWSIERRLQALEIVSSDYLLIAKYSPEELMQFAKNNKDAFDLYVATQMDEVKNLKQIKCN